jgi:hypothetical protein
MPSMLDCNDDTSTTDFVLQPQKRVNILAP